MVSQSLRRYWFHENRLVKDEILRKISALIDRGEFILGAEVEGFEAEFARFCGVRDAIGTSSGTSALVLALKSLALGPDDEVIVPALTWVSTATAVLAAGARVVICDIDADTFNLSVSDLAARIGPKTRAIVPVHLYGQMADLAGIRELARSRDLYVVEDACQAHGAEALIDGQVKKAGAVGDLGCFSFYPSKNLGAFGDAGAITTESPSRASALRALRNYGQHVKNHHEVVGDNARLDAIQAVILSEKLKSLAELNRRRQAVAAHYHEHLGRSALRLPVTRAGHTHVFHQYVVRAERRDALAERLRAKGLEVGIHYPVPIHLQPCFASLRYRRGDFPVAERACDTILSLPMAPYLTEADVAEIAGWVREAESAR